MDVVTLYAPSVFRVHAGLITAPLGARPDKPLELYEFEACPFCRKVREAISMLDLEADLRPCPKGGTRYRPAAEARSGKAQFPFLIDPNTGVELLESTAIVDYLFKTYGTGKTPLVMRPFIATPTAGLGSAFRHGGMRARPSRQPEQDLELVGFEASPWCRRVRETLCELELPYRLTNVAKKSPSRPAFIKRSGKMQVPWLHDPNTGVEMFESADIVRYLDDTYAL